MIVGDAEVYALLDGTHSINVKQLLHGISPDSIAKIMYRNGLDTTYEINFSAFLIKRAADRILVDAGCGEFMGPDAGKLISNLQAIGVKPQDITAILITHGHADHLGGLVDNGKMRFSNATIYISKAESDYWLSPGNKEAAAEDNQSIFDIVAKALTPYINANKLRIFSTGSKILEGIQPINMNGHTPGSTAYLFDSKGQHIFFMGDIVHIAAIQYANPYVTIEWDINQAAAAKARQNEFKKLAHNGYWVAGPHMPFPGIGHIRSNGNAYQWTPVSLQDPL
jgi:glyoxylase-like metal-dependent hydrolase (beta-lactamase superfamily II)